MVDIVHTHFTKYFVRDHSGNFYFILFYIEKIEFDGKTEYFEKGKAAWWLVVG